jgi:histidine triad (HIT) family protein
MDCVFCAIVAGRAPATIVHRWPDALAIVPLKPVTPGHALIIPSAHVPDAAADPIVTAATAGRWAEYAARHGGQMNLLSSVGPVATQTVFHLHLHFVPRRDGDGLVLPWTAA